MSTVDDPMELLDRMSGYIESAKGSMCKGKPEGARMSLSFARSMMRQFDKLTK
jgi:hypothetical protein